ncbi:unnamed protein product [Peniophora sp. CBMAI 1063]|nr:unnamed protein product [Peniophora sp. CBMAI 1063]
MQSIPQPAVDEAEQLARRGMELYERFDRYGDIQDIEDSITKLHLVNELTPIPHPQKPLRLESLGISLRARYLRMGRSEDLELAINTAQLALDLTPEGHPHMPFRLNNLAAYMNDRYTRYGDPEDMERAIENEERALTMTPEGHDSLHLRISNFAGSLVDRYRRHGELQDLERSITLRRQALELTPDGHPAKPMRLADLAVSLEHRYGRHGELEDLEQLIALRQEALDLTPDGHPDKLERLANLAVSLLARYRRHGELEDLERSITLRQQALNLTPDGHPDNPRRLAALAVSFGERYRRHGELDDLERTIALLQQALDITPAGHPDKPERLASLAVSFGDRYRRHGELEDLERSVTLNRQAADLAPDGHPDTVEWLYALAYWLRVRFLRQPSKPGFESTVTCYMESAMFPLGNPVERLRSALECVSFLSQSPTFASSESLLSAHACIFQILPEVVWLGYAVDRRYEESAKLCIIINQSVATAVRLFSLHQAVEWLEAGRSLVWSQILSLRAPLDDLREQYPALADDLDEILCKLQRSVHASRSSSRTSSDATDSSSPSVTANTAADEHRMLVIDYNKILADVRKCTGFENFLQPSKFDGFLPVLKHIDGPVVFINVHSSSCDALALFPNGNIECIPLTALTEDEARGLEKAWITSLYYANARERGVVSWERIRLVDRKNSLGHVLARLWELVVHPILEALKLIRNMSETTGRLPHVTWCPTGPLTRLPLHAAGIYDETEGLGQHAFDHVVSSYTPSLSALLRCQQGPNDLSLYPKVLVVTQPATPGYAPLACTQNERARLATVLPDCARTSLDDKDATVERTLEAMCEHPWVHLACHGSQMIADPLSSSFALYDGPVTLQALMGTVSKNAELAFLSACQTAAGDEKNPEESVHLAAGMLAVGFKGVIATMWSIWDNDAPIIVEAYYKRLLEIRKSGTVAPGYTGAAYALHDAVKVLRDHVGEENFVKWAPFVHFGV